MFKVVLSHRETSSFLSCCRTVSRRSKGVFVGQKHGVTRAMTCTMSSPVNSAPRFTAGRLSRSEKARESLERNVSRGESSDAGK